MQPQAHPLTTCGRLPTWIAVWVWCLFWVLGVGAGTSAHGFSQKYATLYPPEAREIPPELLNEVKVSPWQGPEPGPVPGLRLYARERTGAVWLGSEQGAARFDAQARHPWHRWQYFAGKRWLPDDEVLNIHVDEAGMGRRVWVRTKTGAAQIEWRSLNLGQKATSFEQRIEARHVRHGLVADCALRTPGELSSALPVSNDNDGLWTAMYLGAQAYRYAATRDPDARAKAQRAYRALLRLEQITGLPGFYARSFIAKSEPRPGDGEWHATADGEWLWKGDTSSDESVGHYYGYSLYFDLVADASEKEEIRAVITRMTDYLVANQYELLDVDGKPTRWGRWSEAYFQTDEGKYEAALRSLQVLSFLKTAQHITGDAKYDAAYRDRLAKGYAENARRYRRWAGGGEINFSDDELAYLSFQPLLRYEKDPGLRQPYLETLRYVWTQVASDRNPLWAYISVEGGAGAMTPALRDECRRTLERIPVDLVAWDMRNSHRQDVKFRPDKDRFNRPQTVELLPPDERAIAKWNSNPYAPDGGAGGRSEDDGAFFLLPYWMGRYYGWVE